MKNVVVKIKNSVGKIKKKTLETAENIISKPEDRSEEIIQMQTTEEKIWKEIFSRRSWLH